MYQLEERILFDGAAAVDLAVAQQEQQAQDTQAQAQAETQAHTEAAVSGDQNQTHNPNETSPVIPADTASAVPSSDIASADHSTASLSAPIDASNPSQTTADTHHVNVLVVSNSLENADALFESANSDTIVVRYNVESTTGAELLQEITDALHGEKADSIGFVTDKAHDGSLEIFSDSDTSTQSLSTETQQKFWNGVEGLLAEKGKVNIFASDLASTENGRHLVDSLAQITDHQVAASNDVTGDKDAGGDWELEYVAKGTGSVDLIEEYFNRESIQTFDHRIENPTEIAFIDSSVRDISTIVNQLDKDVEVVYLSRDNAFNDITGYLNGRSDVDSIHLISDGTSGEFYLGNNTVNSDFIASHQDSLAAWGKAMSADGDIHIYGCDLAKDQIGKDLVNQISVITGADVAASVDRTGVAGDWNLEFTTGEIQTAGFIIGDYIYNLKTLTVKRLDDYLVANPSGISESNLTLREAVLISLSGDNINFADYTVLHSASSTTPDPTFSTSGPLYSPNIYHFIVDPLDPLNLIRVDGLVDTLTIKTNITIDGNILTPAWGNPATLPVNHSVILDARPLGATNTFRAIYIDSQMNADGTGVTLQNIIIKNGLSLSTDNAPGAGNGGGIYVSSISSLDFKIVDPNLYETATVKDNQATYGGGIFNAGILKFSGIASSNTASDGAGAGNGGGIYNAGTMTVTGNQSINNNVAAENGGGIYNNGSLSISGGGPTNPFSVSHNTATAGNGGGIYSNTGDISLSYVHIDTNVAGNSGGGIYIFSNYEQSAPIHFFHTDVFSNVAGVDGGGIYLTNANATSTANVFELEWSDIYSNGALAGNGGGIALFNNAGNIAIQTVFGTTSSFNIEAAIFSNSALNGAGVYVENCANVTMDFIYMGSNIATENGGAIFVKDSGTVTLTDMEIVDNSAVFGGGIYYTNATSGTLNVQRSNISNNTATRGGGIYQANGNLVLENDTLSYNGTNIATLGGAIYMDYGSLSINFATLAYNKGVGAAIYIDGDAANTSKIAVTNSIIYNLNADAFNSQIYIPVATEINASGFSTTSNIYSHYWKDTANNPDNSLNLTLSANSLISRLYGDTILKSDAIQSNLYLDTTLLYHANYRTMALAIISPLSWASTSNAAVVGSVTYDQRGNTRSGSTWVWDSIKNTWVTATKTGTIGAFEPLYHVEITSNGDDSQLWYTADQNARYFNTAMTSGTGLTLREAIYWIDTRANALPAEYDTRYIGFNSTYFAVPADGSVNPNNTIQLNYGQIEIGGRWLSWDSTFSHRDVAVGYLIRNANGSVDPKNHDNTLRAQNDINRITVLAGDTGGGVNRLFMNTEDSVLALNNLTISGGVGESDSTQNSLTTNGGGIYNAGILTLTNMVVQNSKSEGGANVTGGNGGGIYNYNTGTAYIYDSSILNNTATAISNENNKSPNAGQGGGIWNGGTMTIDRTRISGNTANGSSELGNAMQGGGIWNGGTATPGLTPGFLVYHAATLTIERSEISGNKVSGSTLDKNAVKGAGIYNSAIFDEFGSLQENATLNMANCTVAENTLDTTGVKIDYKKYTWGSYGSGVFNNGTVVSYYNTVVNNKALVNDGAFWNTVTKKTSDLESMAAFYNADGADLKLSNSLLAENRAILTASGEVWQRADLYVRTAGDVDIIGDNGKYNIIGAYNTIRTEQDYTYLAISTATAVYYELTYNGAVATYTQINQFVAQTVGAAVNTGFDWNDPALNNTVGFYNLAPAPVVATGAPTYLSLTPTTAEFLVLHPLPSQYSGVTAPFIYTPKLDVNGVVDPQGTFIKVTGFDATTKQATFVEFNPSINGGAGSLATGLYTLAGGVYSPLGIVAANAAYSNDVFSATTPPNITVVMGPGGTPIAPGNIPDVSNLRYGIVDNLNLDFTLNYNGALTRTLRVLSGSVAMDGGNITANPGGVFYHLTTDQRGVDRLFKGATPTVITNIGAFDYLSGSLIVRSAADSANPRVGFDYTTYSPLWESGTLTLREAVMLADDGSDITFKDTWQINGSKYIDPVTLLTSTVTNELNATSGNLIINLVGGELLVNRSVTIDGMFQWNVVDINGNITSHRLGGISQLTAGANSRIFDIKGEIAGTLSTVGISNFVMSGGNMTGNGGGIFSSANLWLDNVTIQNNKAITGASGSNGLGGGIYSDQGYLQMIDSTVSGNTAAFGGGIYVSGKNNASGVVLDVGHVNRLVGGVATDFYGGSSIIGNTSNNATNGSGGGVYLLSGNASFIYSTVGSNKTVSDGGGIYVATTGNLTMTNSTVTNNTAGRHGGGIAFNSSSNLNLDYSTVANNQAGWTILGAASGNPFSTGGGVYMNNGALTLANSILAQNFSGKFNNNTALIQNRITPVPITLANLNLGIHDDLYTFTASNAIVNSVYGATGGPGAITPVASTQVQDSDWTTFSTTKLDSKLTDNGGHSKTVYVFNSQYFQQGAAAANMYDQTQLEKFTARITSGAYENSVDKVLYYESGEITKGRDGGSAWINANGDHFTETDGVLNANNTTFVFEDTTVAGHVLAGVATLNYNWTINGPDWTGKYSSWIETRNNASLTINAGTTAALDVTLNGEIIVRNASSLILQSTNLSKMLLSVDHTAISDTKVYYGMDPVPGSLLSATALQTVFTVDAETTGAIQYDNLYLYGKDKVGTAAAVLYTKNAVGSVIVNKDLIVGDASDNVKLNITNNSTFFPGSLTMNGANIHNFGQIALAGSMTVAPLIGNTTIADGGTITVGGDLVMSNVIINTQKTIGVSGNLTMTDVTITGLATPVTTVTVTGNASLIGTVGLTNTTITAGTGKTVSFGDGTPTTVTMNGNVSLGATGASAEFTDNSNIVATGLNNQILSKGLTVTNWLTGTIDVAAAGALKLNIGAQTLAVTDNTTDNLPAATLPPLNLGLDRLTVATNGYFGVVTTGAVTSTVTAPAANIDGTLALSGKIALNNTFSNIVKPAATLELGGTITISTPALLMDNSLSLGNATVDTKLVPTALSITSSLGSISIGNITGVKTLTIVAAADFTLTNSISVGGDLNITAGGNIGSNPITPVKTLNATGNITFTGNVSLQNITVASSKTISFTDNMTLAGNTTIGSSTSTVKLINTTVTATGTNNNIVTKGLDVSTWTAGNNTIQVVAPANGSLKLNVGMQNLSLIAGNGNGASTLTSLFLGVDRLKIDANNRFEIVTTGTAPITANVPLLVAGGVNGTLALNGKVNLNDDIFTLELNAGATLEFDGEVTIKKDTVGFTATINKDSNLLFAGNVKVDTPVTGTVSITANGDVTIGNNISSGPKFTGNKGALNVTSVTGDIWIGNVSGVGTVTIDDGGGVGTDFISVTNSITSTGNVVFTSGNSVEIQAAKATATATTLSPIIITAGTTTTAGAITSLNGFNSLLAGSSELQLSASNLVANSSNIGLVGMNNSFTLLKGAFASGNITLTGNGSNLITKAPLNVVGNIDILGNGKLENSAALTVSGDIQLAGGATTSILNNLATGTINTATIHLLDPAPFAGSINNSGGFNVTGAINNVAGYAIGAKTIAVDGFNGAIAVGSYITITGDPNSHQVVSTVGGAIPTSITFNTALVNAIVDNAVITRVVNTGVTTIYVTGFAGPISVGSFVTVAGDAYPHRVMSIVGGATPTSIVLSEGLKNPVAANAVITGYAPPASLTNAGTITATGAVTLDGGNLTNSKTFTASSIANTFAGILTNSNFGNITNSGTMTVTNNVTLVSTGALNNTGTISAADYNLVSGNLTSSKTLTATGGIAFTDNGSLTNSGTMNVTNGVTLLLNGAFNNNTGTMTLGGNLSLVNGTLTNKAALTVNGAAGIQITGTGGIVNSSTMKSDIIQLASGSMTNSGTITEKAAGSGVDINLTGGSLTNTGTMTAVDVLGLTLNGALNNNTGTMTANTITMVNGTLTNKATLSADAITISGTGNLVNSMTLAVNSAPGGIVIALNGGGSLTNTGTMTTVDSLTLAGSGALNNNAGTFSARTIDMVHGTLTNKANLNVTDTVTGLNITGTGNIVNTMALRAGLITLANGNLTNSGTGTIAETAGFAGSTITLNGIDKTFTNSGTSVIIDNLVLNINNTILKGSILNSSKTLTVENTLTLKGLGVRNITLSGGTSVLTTVGTLDLQSNAVMSQGLLTVTNFNFNGGTYFQMNNSIAGATLKITGDYVLGTSGLNGCDATHYFVTSGSSKVWIKTTSTATQNIFLTDNRTNLLTNPVIEIDVTGNTATADKLVGLSTFKPVTVNGKYDGVPAGAKSQANSVNRVWTVTRTTGDATNLTVKFSWDATDQGAGLLPTAKLFMSTGTSWGPYTGITGTRTSLTSFESNLITNGAYSVSNNPIMAMNDNSLLGSQFDELKEKFIDAIFGTREDLIGQQQVAEAQERSAMENMFSQMANRGNLMERNKLFKTDIDIGLEELLAV